MVLVGDSKGYISILLPFVILVLVRFLYIINIGIAPDEAYYWDWTRFLSLGYYDHPPLVAWVTFCTTSLFGNTIAGIKTAAFIGHFLTSLCAIGLARKYCYHYSSLLLLILLFWFSVIIGIGTLILSPDVPQYLFWSAGMLAGYCALFESSRKAWIVLGIVGGLGLLSKYVFILFFLSLAVFILIMPEFRSLIKSPYPYMACAVSFFIFLPNIIWNANHGWPSFSFQMKHGLGTDTGFTLNYFIGYIIKQIGIVTPLLFIMLMYAIQMILRKYRHNAGLIYLTLFTLTPLIVFGISSIKKRGEANWPAPAYIAGFILIAWLWDTALRKNWRKIRAWIIVSTGFSILFTIPIYIHIYYPVLPIPYRLDMTKQIRGWKAFADDFQTIREDVDPALTLPVCANRYQETSLLAFYLPDQPRTFSLNIERRSNHYALLDNKHVLYERQCFFIQKLKNGTMPSHLKRYFETVSLVGTIYLHQSSKKKAYGVFLVSLPKSNTVLTT